jgi:hypothetical protein
MLAIWFHIKSNGTLALVTVTVKNIPDVLYERLKLVAETNRRFIDSESDALKMQLGVVGSALLRRLEMLVNSVK